MHKGETVGISTHILDQVSGQPAQGVEVKLFFGGEALSLGQTDADGRVSDLLSGQALKSGSYKLAFSVGEYLKQKKYVEGIPFFNDVEVNVNISDIERHYHIPLLLSPYGYSTYRGS